MIIQQGDQYKIPFKIKVDGTYITPSDCEDIKIKIGKYTKSYADDQIIYNTAQQTWDYPITQEMTRNLSTIATMYQVGIKFSGNEMVYTKPDVLDVDMSIIKEAW